MKKIISFLLTFGVWNGIVHAQNDFIVHEWGTFTDVQGGDGELLSWRPLQTSELPGFVYNWIKPGLNRASGPMLAFGKGGLVTLQRMETPVIYFYSDKGMKVDVNVAFPGGLITEWYPQATQIGPSFPLNTNVSAAATLRESRAVWNKLSIAPAGKYRDQRMARLPQDKSGSHYFAARDTGADFVQTDSGAGNENEAFIFYRGAGSFKTPLRVSVNANNEIVVENTGDQPLSHLFLLGIKNGRSAFDEITSLPPGERKILPAIESQISSSDDIKETQAKLGTAMQAALVSEGLFADEAKAMVNTWKDSWFAEDGVRVLYLLPRAWTDETLPLTLNPKPEKIVRVMVGRAEVITPAAENDLKNVLTKAGQSETAHRQAIAELKKLGRFAEPAVQLVNRHAGPTGGGLGYQLLPELTQPQPPNLSLNR